MKKNALVTLTLGESTQQLATITHPFFKEYARRHGLAFEVIEHTLPGLDHPKLAKFYIYDLLTQYDRILYLDTDILLHPNCPNLFDLVPEGCFGAFFDSNGGNGDADIPEWRNQEIADFQARHNEIGWTTTYFNSGVMVISQCHREIFNYHQPVNRGRSFIDQTQLNYNLQILGYPSFDFGPKFNFLLALNRSQRMFDTRFNAYVIHYAGFNDFYPEHSLLERVKADAKTLQDFASNQSQTDEA